MYFESLYLSSQCMRVRLCGCVRVRIWKSRVNLISSSYNICIDSAPYKHTDNIMWLLWRATGGATLKWHGVLILTCQKYIKHYKQFQFVFWACDEKFSNFYLALLDIAKTKASYDFGHLRLNLGGLPCFSNDVLPAVDTNVSVDVHVCGCEWMYCNKLSILTVEAAKLFFSLYQSSVVEEMHWAHTSTTADIE